jgi:hypothetical protein
MARGWAVTAWGTGPCLQASCLGYAGQVAELAGPLNWQHESRGSLFTSCYHVAIGSMMMMPMILHMENRA